MLPIIGYVIGGAVLGGWALMAHRDDKKADDNVSKASATANAALAQASARVEALNGEYRAFFNEAVRTYQECLDELRHLKGFPARGLIPDIVDPGDIKYNDPLDVTYLSKIDFRSLSWSQINDQAANIFRQSFLRRSQFTSEIKKPLGASPGATFSTVLMGQAGQIAGAYTVSTIQNYADKAAERLTASVRQISDAETYKANITEYVCLIERSMRPDIADRRQSLYGLVEGVSFASLNKKTWKLAVSTLSQIIELIERPLNSPKGSEE